MLCSTRIADVILERAEDSSGLEGGSLCSANLQLATCNLQPETGFVQFQKITLAGVGLLGGSLGLAVKQRGLAKKVDGLVRRSSSITECDELAALDHPTRDPLPPPEHPDLPLPSTPLPRMPAALQRTL